MIWWTCFFATAAAIAPRPRFNPTIHQFTTFYNRPRIQFYTNPKTVYGGDSFDLFCYANHGRRFEYQLKFIEQEGEQLNFTAISSYTIRHSILKTQNEGAFLHFLCDLKGTQLKLEVVVIPKLNVRDFECISRGDELVVECSFGQLGIKTLWDSMKYNLSIDNGINHECQTAGNRIECTTIYSNATTENLNHTFTLQLECNRDVQKQIFYLSRTQMKVPPWTSLPRFHRITKRGILTCIVYELDLYSKAKYDYKMLLLPRNLRNMEIRVEPIKRSGKEICFHTPRFNNQTFELRVWLRYIGIDTPWTRDYYAFIIQTEAIPPNWPPQLQPGVFFYEPKKKYFYIFWKELEELEINRQDFTYTVQTTTGKKAIAKTNSSAVFRQWDPTKPATVLVWNQNSVGRSKKTSKLEVPALTNSVLHQPQDLWYHFENQSMTWRPPMDMNNLVSYIVIWCSVSSNSTFLCEDQKPLHFESVPASIQNYQFNTQAADLNKAVVALYEDEKSGGMVWIGPIWTDNRKTESKSSGIDIIIYLIGTVTIGAIPIIVVLFRKLKKMSQIDIVFPEGLFDANEMTNRFVNPPEPIAIPGSVSPRSIVNIEKMRMKTISEEEPYTTSSSHEPTNEPSIEPRLNVPTEESSITESLSMTTEERKIVSMSYVTVPQASAVNLNDSSNS